MPTPSASPAALAAALVLLVAAQPAAGAEGCFRQCLSGRITSADDDVAMRSAMRACREVCTTHANDALKAEGVTIAAGLSSESADPVALLIQSSRAVLTYRDARLKTLSDITTANDTDKKKVEDAKKALDVAVKAALDGARTKQQAAIDDYKVKLKLLDQSASPGSSAAAPAPATPAAPAKT